MCGFMRRPQSIGTFVPADAFFLWTFSFSSVPFHGAGFSYQDSWEGGGKIGGKEPLHDFSLVLPPPPMRTQHYFIVLLRLFFLFPSLFGHTHPANAMRQLFQTTISSVWPRLWFANITCPFLFFLPLVTPPPPLSSHSRSLSSWTPAISCVTQSRYMRKRVHACMHAYVHGEAWHTTTGALLFQPSPSFFSPLPFPLLHFRSATLPCSLGKEERGREWWPGKTYSPPFVLPLPWHPYPRVLPSSSTYIPTHIPRVLLSSLPPPSQVDWAQGRPSGT